LVYSVCTLTTAEHAGVADLVAADGRLEQLGAPPGPWVPRGPAAMVLPDAERDGMVMMRWVRR
ncbi:MAG: hypothetical protein ACE5GB_00435, partial [Acidimicrobiales bacterium]